MGSDQDGVPSKVSDSGVGGLESGEDSWISDTEVSQLTLFLAQCYARYFTVFTLELFSVALRETVLSNE